MSTPIKQGLDKMLGIQQDTPITQFSNDSINSLFATLQGSWEKTKQFFTTDTCMDLFIIGSLSGIILTIVGARKWGSRITVISILLAVIIGGWRK